MSYPVHLAISHVISGSLMLNLAFIIWRLLTVRVAQTIPMSPPSIVISILNNTEVTQMDSPHISHYHEVSVSYLNQFSIF